MNLELEQLGERIAEQAAHLDAAMHRLLVDLREFDQRGGWHAQGARSCAHWLAWRVGWDLVTAREHVRVAGRLAEFAAIDDALRRGEVSYSKVRAMLRVATPANERLLLDHARLMTASQLETLCRKYAAVQRHGADPHPRDDEQRRFVRRRDTDDGMVKIEAVLHPEEAELVWAMLNHAATQLAREPDALAGQDSAESWAVGPFDASAAAEAAPSPVTSRASGTVTVWPAPEASPVSGAVANSSLRSDAIVCRADDSAESSAQRPEPEATAPTAAASVQHCAPGTIGDSAESSAQHAAPGATAPTATASVQHCAPGTIGDSAESSAQHAAPQATVPTAAASPQHCPLGTIGDSAESSAQRAEPQATASTATASVQHCAPGTIGDSAESSAQHAARQATAPTEATSPQHCALGTIGDSAESSAQHAVRQATAPTEATSPQHCALGTIGDSAEASEQRAEADTTAPGYSETGQTDDSAESPRAEVPHRSLLDRLLDEADALRSADAWTRGEAEDSSSTLAAASRSKTSSSTPPAERAPSGLRQRAEAARRAFHRADALVSVAQGYLRGDRPDRSPIEVVLTLAAGGLRDAAADPVEVGEIGASLVSSEAARRLSCDAGVVEVVEDEQGTPLSVGRKRRTIAGALKRALRKRDTACTFPGCTNRLFLEGHHIKHWADGGETSLRNAALLCSAHHRHVHEYGYTIELGPDQRPRFRDPRGRLVAEVPDRPVMADLGWPRIRAMNQALAIDADTIACGWDGTPADYGAMVGHLLATERTGGPPASPGGA